MISMAEGAAAVGAPVGPMSKGREQTPAPRPFARGSQVRKKVKLSYSASEWRRTAV